MFGLCYSDDAPCVRQVCDEFVDSCRPCASDPECSDGRFCNGVEQCIAGRCVPGESPCQTNVCLEDSNSCDVGPTIAWVPMDPAGTADVDGYIVLLPSGGRQVSLELRVYDWGLAQGNPVLGVFQAALDSAALSNGYGPPITPVGWPDDPELGVLEAPYRLCSVSGAIWTSRGDITSHIPSCPGENNQLVSDLS